MVQITDTYAYSSDGRLLRRRGTDVCGRCISLLPTDTADSFEEIDTPPPYTKDQYDRRVEELIARRYTTGQEIQFAREREAAGEKYTEYLAYVASCKTEARAQLAAGL